LQPKALANPVQRSPNFPRGQHQHLVARRRQIRYRSLHHAGARRSQHQNVILRANEFFHVGQHTLKQRLEVGGAVVRGKRSHCRLRGRQKRSRSGSKKAILMQHFDESW
jgi:hypothetical protein